MDYLILIAVAVACFLAPVIIIYLPYRLERRRDHKENLAFLARLDKISELIEGEYDKVAYEAALDLIEKL